MDYKEYFYRLTRKKTNFQWILGVYYVRKRQSGGENRQLYDVNYPFWENTGNGARAASGGKLRNGYAGGGIFAGKPDSPYLF